MTQTNENFKLKEDTFDFKIIIFFIFRNWYIFLISIFITLILSYLYNKYTQPVYKVSTTILIKENKFNQDDNSELLALKGFDVSRNIQNEIGIIKSYNLAFKTLQELPEFEVSCYTETKRSKKTKELFGDDSPFNIIIDTSHFQARGIPININIISKDKYNLSIKNLNINKVLFFGENFENDNFKFAIYFKDNINPQIYLDNNFKIVFNDIYSLASSYSSSIVVSTINKEASIVEVTFTTNNAQKALTYINKLAEVYIKSDLYEKNLKAINTINFINSQLSEITDSLTINENNLVDFRTKSKVFNIFGQANYVDNQLLSLNQSKSQEVIKLKYYNYLLDYVSNNKNFQDVIAPSTMNINDPLLLATIKNLTELNNQKELWTKKPQSTNPYFTLIEEQISNNKKTLIELVQNFINVSNITLKEIENNIQIVQNQLNKLPINERDYQRIQRKYGVNDEIYTYLLQKKAEAAIAKAANIPDNKIIDDAKYAALIYPNKKRSYLIALVLGLLIPFSIIRIRDYFNDRIIDKSDVENNTNIPIIGVISHSEYDLNLVVLEKPKSIVSESVRAIKTNMQFYDNDSNKKIIAVTSAMSGEGKTFSTINIAGTFALSGKKVLILGCDLRKPKIQKIFNIENKDGLTNYLIGKSTKEEITYLTNYDNLYIIPSGIIPPNPAELIESSKMKTLLNELVLEYDYIFIDTPPLGFVSDAVHIIKNSDFTIYVVRQNYTNKKSLFSLNDLVKTANINKIGIIINDIKFASRSYKYSYRKYGYGYGLGYGYGYGYGYGIYSEESIKKTYKDKIKNALGFSKKPNIT